MFPKFQVATPPIPQPMADIDDMVVTDQGEFFITAYEDRVTVTYGFRDADNTIVQYKIRIEDGALVTDRFTFKD